MHALQIWLTIAATITATGVIVGVVQRFALRPMRRAIDQLHLLAREAAQIDDRRRELSELAGSVVTLAVALVDAHRAMGDRLAATTGLTIELNDDVHQLRGEVAELRAAM